MSNDYVVKIEPKCRKNRTPLPQKCAVAGTGGMCGLHCAGSAFLPFCTGIFGSVSCCENAKKSNLCGKRLAGSHCGQTKGKRPDFALVMAYFFGGRLKTKRFSAIENAKKSNLPSKTGTYRRLCRGSLMKERQLLQVLVRFFAEKEKVQRSAAAKMLKSRTLTQERTIIRK